MYVCFCVLSPEDQLPPGFPSITMGPQLKVVERARTATMLCAASGTPDPEITWFKDFLPIDTRGNGRIKQLRSGTGGGFGGYMPHWITLLSPVRTWWVESQINTHQVS